MKNKVDMSDVCELAHELTVRECYELDINVNCKGLKDCGDNGQDHRKKADGTHYGKKAQEIFDYYYDMITNRKIVNLFILLF